MVIPVVRSSELESFAVTQALVPLNERALLNLPPVTQVVFETVPALLFPDWSAVVVPVPSSNAQPPTSPAAAVLLTVTPTFADVVVLFAASRATAVSVCGALDELQVSHWTE